MATTKQWGRIAALALAAAILACRDDAGHVTGRVTAEAGGAALAGIRVVLHRFENGRVVTEARTDSYGKYWLDAAPGSYYVEFANDGEQPYASELYSATAAFPNGVNNRLQAQRLDLAEGGVLVVNGSLSAGLLLQGTVTASGAPAAGQVVRIADAASGYAGVSFSRTTDASGRYRTWLRPETYQVRARGQLATVSLTAGGQTRDFSADVGTIDATLLTAEGAPASIYGYAYDARNLSSTAFDWEFATADGALTLFVPAGVTSVVLELRSDAGEMIGSSIYSGGTRLYDGTRVTAPAPGTSVDLGTVTLPAGGVLTGKVLKNGAPRVAQRVQIRSGGTTGADVFTTVRTRSDGSYTLGLPAGTYARVCTYEGGTSCGAPGTSAFQEDVVITAGATTTLDLSY